MADHRSYNRFCGSPPVVVHEAGVEGVVEEQSGKHGAAQRRGVHPRRS